METIPKNIIDGLSLKLPANIKGLLNTRNLDIYDVIQMLVNTTNKSNRSIKQAIEVLDEWLKNKNAELEAFKNSIIDYTATGQFNPEGFISSSAAFNETFWGDISSKMIRDIRLLRPNDPSNNYDGGNKWVLRFDMYNDSVKWVDATILLTNLQFDIDSVRGLVVTDNNEEFSEIGQVPFASASSGGLMSRIDKSKLDNIRWDSDNGLLYIDNVCFQLTPYQEEPTRTYYAPTITDITYEDIPNSGGSVRPVVHVEQQVRIGSGEPTIKIIYAAYEYDSVTGQMKTTYVNGDYMKADGALQMEFFFTDVATGVVTNTNGTVTKQSASSVAERALLAKVAASATMNGVSVESSASASVYQSAAEIEYEYQEPELVSFEYPSDISRNGGSARPKVVVSQQVVVTTGSRTETKTITATYQWNSSRGQMEATYVNGSYMKQDGSLALTFEFDDLAQGVTTASSGVVTKTSPSATTVRSKVASATVSATMNGESAEESLFADAYQQAAARDMTVYYGTSATLPTELGSNTFALQDGVNTINIIDTYGHVQWAAVPSSLSASVVIADTDGDEVPKEINDSQLSGYILYYWYSFVESDGARITITV